MNLNFNPASFGVDSSNDFSAFLDTGSVKETKAKDAVTPQNNDAAYKAAEHNATSALTKLSQNSRSFANEGLGDNFVRSVTDNVNAHNQLSAFSSRSVEQAASTPDKELKYKIAQRSEDIMSAGIEVMYIFMNLISGQANNKFDEMKRKAEISADAKEQSSVIDGIMAGLDKPDSTDTLSDDVIKYMRDNNILVEGKTIDEWLNGNTSLNKSQFMQVKGAIDNVSNRAGDFVTQSQLELQKLMQLFSLLTNQISTLQTKKKDDISTIIRGMG